MMPSELEYHYHGLGLSPWNDNEILDQSCRVRTVE